MRSQADWQAALMPASRRRGLLASLGAAALAILVAIPTFRWAARMSAVNSAAEREVSALRARHAILPDLEERQHLLLDRVGAAAAFRPSDASCSPLIRALVSRAEASGLAFRSVRTGPAEGGKAGAAGSVLVEISFAGRYRAASSFVSELERVLPFARIERLGIATKEASSPDGAWAAPPVLTAYLRSPLRRADETGSGSAYALRRTSRDPMEPVRLGPEPTPPASSLPILSGIVWDPSSPLAILVDPRSGETRLMKPGEGDKELKVRRVTETEVDVAVQGRAATLKLAPSR